MDSVRVFVVIVNYNSEDLTRQCIRSLQQLAQGTPHIIIVDNASPDGSGTRLRDDFAGPSISVELSTSNRGFGAGCNIGIRESLKRGADFVWLLNPDTEVAPSALEELLKPFAEQEDVAATGSKIYYCDPAASDRGRIWGAGGKIDISTRTVEMFGAGQPDSDEFNRIRECDYLPGCSLLVSRKTLDRVGMMPEEYFMYFEETDWCVRMRRAKGRLLYTPNSVVYHKFDDKKLNGPFMVYYYNRNQNIFWSRQLGLVDRLKLYLRVVLRDLPRARKAKLACQDPMQREIFRAHHDAAVDFLKHRYGERATP